MALKKSQRSLKAWGKQKWRTKSGKPSTQGPKATGATTAKKRKATRKGKQVAKQPKKIAKKTSRFRKFS